MSVEIKNLTIVGRVQDNGKTPPERRSSNCVTREQLESVRRELQLEFRRLIRQSARNPRER